MMPKTPMMGIRIVEMKAAMRPSRSERAVRIAWA